MNRYDNNTHTHTWSSVEVLPFKAELLKDSKTKEPADVLEGRQVWVLAKLVSMKRKRGRRQIAVGV